MTDIKVPCQCLWKSGLARAEKENVGMVGILGRMSTAPKGDLARRGLTSKDSTYFAQSAGAAGAHRSLHVESGDHLLK